MWVRNSLNSSANDFLANKIQNGMTKIKSQDFNLVLPEDKNQGGQDQLDHLRGEDDCCHIERVRSIPTPGPREMLVFVWIFVFTILMIETVKFHTTMQLTF